MADTTFKDWAYFLNTNTNEENKTCSNLALKTLKQAYEIRSLLTRKVSNEHIIDIVLVPLSVDFNIICNNQYLRKFGI